MYPVDWPAPFLCPPKFLPAQKTVEDRDHAIHSLLKVTWTIHSIHPAEGSRFRRLFSDLLSSLVRQLDPHESPKVVQGYRTASRMNATLTFRFATIDTWFSDTVNAFLSVL